MYILDLLFSKLPLGVSCCVIAEHILLKGWEGPLIDSTNNLQASFITKILHLSSLIPPHSLQITQSSIAYGGLGLYRPSARAIPTSFSQWSSKPSTTAGIKFHTEAPNYQHHFLVQPHFQPIIPHPPTLPTCAAHHHPCCGLSPHPP